MIANALQQGVRRQQRAARRRRVRRVKVVTGALVAAVLAILVVAPIYWLVVASTKNTAQLFSSPTFLPARHLSLVRNLHGVFSKTNGDFGRWFVNSAIYAFGTSALTTVVCTLSGYAIAKYRFRIRRLTLGLVVGSLMIPTTALVVPTFMLDRLLGMTNTYQGVILPLAVSPFGVYLMAIYTRDAVPDALVDASRIDGAREWTILLRIARPLLMPAMATLFLLTFVGTWNNYFLPLVLLSDSGKFPLTVGLGTWASELHVAGVTRPLYPEVLLGSLISVLPMLVLFPLLQKYVTRGLTLGAVAGE